MGVTIVPGETNSKEYMLRHLTISHSTASTASNASSALSELTASTSKRSSRTDDDQGQRRTSQLSQLMDIAETADEVEILSNYSGMLGHGYASSPSLAGFNASAEARLSNELVSLNLGTRGSSASPLRTEDPPPVKSKLLMSPSSRRYHSEGNLLDLTLTYTPERTTRAMSEDLLHTEDQHEPDVEEESPELPQHRDKNRRGTSIFRSPIKWIPQFFRPFRKRQLNAIEVPELPSPPPTQHRPHTPPPSAYFQILPLSMEPHSGLHYYRTDKEKDAGAERSTKLTECDDEPDFTETLRSIPSVLVNPSPSGSPVELDPLQSAVSSQTISVSELTPGSVAQGIGFPNSQTSQESYFLHDHTQDHLSLPVTMSDCSSRSTSPVSPSSGYSGGHSAISTSPSTSSRLTSQMSQESENDFLCASPRQRHQYPRLRTNSAPYKLHGVRHKSSMTSGSRYDERPRNQPQRNHSTTASDYRSISPDKPITRETSDYFSTSDIAGTLTPETPISRYGSQSISEEDVLLTPTMQHRQFPECMPVRRHSLNSRSRYKI